MTSGLGLQLKLGLGPTLNRQRQGLEHTSKLLNGIFYMSRAQVVLSAQ